MPRLPRRDQPDPSPRPHLVNSEDGSWEHAANQVIAARDEPLALLAVGAEKQSDYDLITSRRSAKAAR